MRSKHIGERGDLVLRIDHAGRVRRVVEQEHPGLARQRLGQLLGPEFVVLLGRARQQRRLRTNDVGDVGVARPVRGRKHDLVARIQQRFGEVVQHLFGADADDEVLALVAVEAAVLQMLQERIEQRLTAAIGTVLTAVVRERLARRSVHMLARQEIRHADREADDVLARRFELLRLLGHGHDRAGLGPAHAFSQQRHFSLLDRR